MDKKIINSPQDVVIQTGEGFLAAYGEYYERIDGCNAFCVKNKKDKTAIVVGGGSGHEPLFAFMIGENMADASAAGNVFTSPDPNTIMQAALSVDSGKGILFVQGNYAGDNMNFDIASEMLEDMGIRSKIVRVRDDVASSPKERAEDRRGIAGNVLVIKIAGAATACGLNLDETYHIACEARDRVYSAGFSLSGVTIPGEEQPIFTLEDDEIEYGVGIHGEAGVQRMKLLSADHMVSYIVEKLLADSGIKAGDEVVTLVNGLGSVTLIEKLIMNRRLAEILREKQIAVYDMDIGDYVTSLDMKGVSITIMKMNDELKKYYDMPCTSPFYMKKGR